MKECGILGGVKTYCDPYYIIFMESRPETPRFTPLHAQFACASHQVSLFPPTMEDSRR